MPHSPRTPEFQIIERYFSELTPPRADVALGIGDDAALLRVPPGSLLVVSVDTLVAGVHFLPSVAPERLGHKALAVNLSDLAAMGAEPAWATLALTLPLADDVWLQGFARGFGELARRHGVQLIGGDTTRGPLSITIQVHGLVPEGAALRRSGARAGEGIYVTGCLGDAALCLRLLQSGQPTPAGFERLRERLELPQPRLEAGQALRGLASSAIDISDGLLADLGHILEAGDLGASVELERLPLSETFRAWLAGSGDWTPALAGGDDYELCFTAAGDREPEIQALSRALDLPICRIGTVERQPGLRVLQADGSLRPLAGTGYDHFAEAGKDG